VSKKNKTTSRNRAIFADHRAGRAVSELVQSYGLAPDSIVAIIRFEKHRLEVSEDEFYQRLRFSLAVDAFSVANAAE
jgi:Mor family transcriptional regulator